ncbi:MFS transporter [Thermodesulfobacteriota bacterium]
MNEDQRQEKTAMIVAAIAAFTGPFMFSSVNVALPAIQKEFSVHAVQLGWIATSLMLAMAVLLVPIGKIADIHGRKKIFMWGLILNILASLFACFVGSVEMLIGSRVIQGMAMAMSNVTGVAILTSVFPPQKRGKAMGVYVSAVYIGLSMGPFIGGLFTQHLGWRSLFLIVALFCGVSFYVTWKHLKGEWAEAKGEKLDILGCILYGIAILALVYGATVLLEMKAIYLIAIGILSLVAFIWHELKTSFPVFEVRLLTGNKLFAFSSLAALINYSATSAITFLLSLYLQYIKGLSPQYAGVVLMVQPVLMAILSPVAGKWSDRGEPRKIASSGMAITAIGVFLFAFIGTETSKIYIICTLAIVGLGFAMFSAPNMSAIMGAVKKRYLGIASGTVSTMRLLGQMMSMAIAMVIFSLFLGKEEISPSNYDLFLRSIYVSFLIFAILCVIGIFFSLVRGSKDKARA